MTKGEVVGDKVILTIEPAKGGASEIMEADVALVSIGECANVQMWLGMLRAFATLSGPEEC